MTDNLRTSPPDGSSATFGRQEKMDLLVGYLLLAGVVLSLALIVMGLVWRFCRVGHFSAHNQLTGMNLLELLAEEIRIAVSGQLRPRTLVDGGIAVLMLTPFVRVLASMFYFMIGLKNWKYTVFTGIVLGVLTFSLFIR